MGVQTVVLVPKKKLWELSLWELGDLLKMYGISWYNYEDYAEDEIVSTKTVNKHIIELLDELEETNDEEEYGYTTKDIVEKLKQAKRLYVILYVTGAILVPETEEEKICELLGNGYALVVERVCGKEQEEELEWVEDICGTGKEESTEDTY